MSKEEDNKSLMRRWYDEMWGPCNFDLIPQFAGPNYTRHDIAGTRTVTAEEYRDTLKQFGATWKITDFKYFLMAEGNFVTSIGSWKINDIDGQGGEDFWHWVQCFRVENGKLAETWLPGMGDKNLNWQADVDVPDQSLL